MMQRKGGDGGEGADVVGADGGGGAALEAGGWAFASSSCPSALASVNKNMNPGLKIFLQLVG